MVEVYEQKWASLQQWIRIWNGGNRDDNIVTIVLKTKKTKKNIWSEVWAMVWLAYLRQLLSSFLKYFALNPQVDMNRMPCL